MWTGVPDKVAVVLQFLRELCSDAEQSFHEWAPDLFVLFIYFHFILLLFSQISSYSEQFLIF